MVNHNVNHKNIEPINSLKDKEKIRILFVCLGNICRSVTAEEIFRTLAARRSMSQAFEVDSAGLIDYHKGELADERMRSHAARRGYHLTHRSRPVTHADFQHFDLIFAMDGRNRDALLRLAEDDAERAKVMMTADFLRRHPNYDIIPDPYYGAAADFELVIDLLEDACENILERLIR